MRAGSITKSARFAPIIHVLQKGKYRAIVIACGLIYAISYMLIVGIVSYVPGLSSATTGVPVLRLTSLGISSVPADNIFFFIFYGALVFLVASSFLVGLNVALILYSRKVTMVCSKAKRVEPKGLFGIFPAFFTSFSCCGGGLLAIAIGPIAFSSLSLYSQYMAPLTVVALAAGTYFISKEMS